jgi:hypothetical protein
MVVQWSDRVTTAIERRHSRRLFRRYVKDRGKSRASSSESHTMARKKEENEGE